MSEKGLDVLITADPGQFKKAIAEAERRIEQFGAKSDRSLGAITKASNKAAAAVSVIGNQAAGLAKLTAEAQKAGKGIDGLAAAADRAKVQAGSMTAAMAGAFAGLSIGLGAAVREFATFEQKLNTIRAVSGATEIQMKSLTAQALALGATTKFSAAEAADGMGELAKAGFGVDQVMKAIPGVLSAAAAGGVGVAQAAEAVGSALNGFGLAAENAGKVADILAKTANISAVGIGDLQNSLKYIAPIAASTSQSIEEVSTALALLGNAGIKSEQAGTTVRSMLSSLVKPSDDAGKMMEKLGLAVTDTHKRVLPLEVIVGQLRDKTEKMGEAQRAAAIATIFGQEALSGVLALMKQTPEAYAAASKEVRAFEGASKDMADVMNKGVIASLEEMKGSFSTLGITVGESFAPAIQALAGGARESAAELAKMPESVKSLVTILASSTFVFTGAAAALGSIGIAARGASIGMASLGISTKAALPALAVLAIAVGVVTDAMDKEARANAARRAEIEKGRKEALEAVTTARIQRDSLIALAKEHDTLAGKAKLTKDEQKRLNEIQKTLETQHPQIAAAIKKSGDRHWEAAKGVRDHARAVDELIGKKLQLARMEGVEIQQRAAAATAKLNDLRQRQANVTKPANNRPGIVVDPFVAAATSAARATVDREVADQQRIVDATARDWMAQVQAEAKLNTAAKPPAPAAAKTDESTWDPYEHQGRGKAGGSAAGAASTAANQEFQTRKALAEEAARYEEEIGKQRYEAERALIDSRIRDLEHQRDMGIKTEEEYLLAVEGFKREQIDLDARASQARLTQERKTTETEIAAVKDAIAKGAKGRADEAAGLAKKLDTIDAKRGTVEIARINQVAALHQDTTNAVAKRKKQVAEEEMALQTEIGAKVRQTADMEREAIVKTLPLLERESAELEAMYEARRIAALAERDAEYDRAATIEAKGEAYADEAQAIRENADAAVTAIQKVADADLTNGYAAIAQRNKAAFQDLQAALVALAADPTPERFANIIRDFAGSEDRIKRIGAVLKDAAKASGDADNGLEGAAAAAGVLGSNLNPIGLMIGAIVAGSELVAKQWEAAANSAERLKNSALTAARMEAERTGDPLKKKKVAEEELADWWNGVVDEEKNAIFDEAGVPGFIRGLQNPNSYMPKLMERLEKRSPEYSERRAGIDQDFISNLNRWAETHPTAPGFTGSALDPTTDTGSGKAGSSFGLVFEDPKFKEANTTADAAIDNRYNNALDRINAINEELERGERDNLGNRISLAAKRDLDLAETKKDYQERINALAEREAEIRDDIRKTEEERLKAVRAIEGESIAVRAETESQSKLRRIDEVNQQAADRTAALTGELADIATRNQAEKAAYEEATTRIKNLANERILALNDEHGAVMANVDAIRLEIGAVDDLTDALLRRAQAAKSGSIAGAPTTSRGSSSGGASSGGGSVSAGTVRDNLSGAGKVMWDGRAWNAIKRHGGGLVPGPLGAEVPIVAKAGERVYTAEQDGWVRDMAAILRQPLMMDRGAQGGGTTVVSVGGIHINGGFDLYQGEDRRRLASLIASEVYHASGRAGGRVIQLRGGIQI